jgi:hypothetical protein
MLFCPFILKCVLLLFVVYLTTLSVAQVIQHRMMGLDQGTEENHEKHQSG